MDTVTLDELEIEHGTAILSELTTGEIAAGERWVSQLNEFADRQQRQHLLPVATE